MMTLLPEVSPKAHREAISRFLDSVGRELFFGRLSLIAVFLTRFARWRLHLAGISSQVGRWSPRQVPTILYFSSSISVRMGANTGAMKVRVLALFLKRVTSVLMPTAIPLSRGKVSKAIRRLPL